ncbi:MAG: T9SS type A sorting domain-containing protein [Bacteroidales bacterium]|nr:T9SS type A sorting domain-containing protein [Bacteroidales bacterium]MCB9012831.1 T9SS type A sorting domain-containing protein [Bacteroidales bacterium]
MKKILLGTLVMLAFVSMGYAQPAKLYFDLEGTGPKPEFKNQGATFNGIVANPLKDAVNGSDSVAMTTTGANGYDGIYITLPSTVYLKADTVFTMLVYSATYTGRTRLQFDGGGIPSQKIQDAGYVTAGVWMKLSFPVSKLYDAKINKILFIFDDAKTRTAPQEWYFDDLMGPNLYEIPKTIEPGVIFNSSSKQLDFTGADGAMYSIARNPLVSYPNSNNPYAGKAVTGTTAHAALTAGINAQVDFTDTKMLRMNVYSASTGNVTLMLEKDGTAEKLSLTANYDTPNAWNYLTFDASAASLRNDWDKVSLIFDDGEAVPGEVWYFDELSGPKLTVASDPKFVLNTDFETMATTPVKVYDANGGAFGGVKENPYPAGANTSDSVGLFIKGNLNYSCIIWYLSGNIDWNQGRTFKMMVYHPDSVGVMRIQAEHIDGGTPEGNKIKMFANYTTAGEWQELYFNLDSSNTAKPSVLPDNYYDRLLISFDNRSGFAGEEWYFDNIYTPGLTPTYIVKALYTLTVNDATPAKVQVDIDNNGMMMDLYDDGTNGDVAAGDNIWSNLVLDALVGDHTVDIYVDDVQIANGMDAPVVIPPSRETVNVAFDYTPHEVLFKVTAVNSSATDFKIDINNSGSKTQLYDDGTHGDVTAGDNVWTVSMMELPFGDHVFDVFADDALVSNGDNVAFNLPETGYPLDVAFTYTGTVSVKANLAGNISIYPNPAIDNINISSDRRISALKIYNIIGSEIMNVNTFGESKVTINTSAFKSGIYTIKISDEAGNTSIRKFIKK